MSHRRNFIKNAAVAGAAALLSPRAYSFPTLNKAKGKPLQFGIISDLHHLQWGKTEEPRLKAFMDEVVKISPDFIVQCGDFCRPLKSEGIMREWNRFKGPKFHVLGNHDMDVCDKATIMKLWGMEQRYYSFDEGGFHFVVMDRNFLRNDDGTLADYASSNWGPLPSPKRSFTDSAQLEWLKADLAKADKPVVVFMHQPVFISDFFDEIGNANEILAIFDSANYNAKKAGKQSSVIAVFMGHDHDDRYGERNGVHYFLINSATYVYSSSGAHFYKDALFAFVTLDPAGKIIIEGRSTTYRDNPPEIITSTFPSKISSHNIQL